jgi:hypothetical protein
VSSHGFPIRFTFVLAAAFAVASVAMAVTHPPDVDPANFTCTGVTNGFFPLVPGTTWTYQGESEGVPTSDVTEVTCGTLDFEIKNDAETVIGTVTTTVVHDRAFENGILVEDTLDYFATDCDGNVWYFGEDSTECPCPGGSTEGSWREGVDDADAGTIMLANPKVGDRYFQEFAPKVAVDQARVISLNGEACVPYGTPDFCSDELLVTKETSQLDPGIVENKYYASGIGFIRGEIVKGGDEFTELVSFTPGLGCGN